MDSNGWDRHSNVYESNLTNNITPFGIIALTLAQITSKGSSDPQSYPCKIIDIACGPGDLSIELAKRGHTILSTDFSPQMLAKVNSKAKSLNLGNNITTQVADGETLEGIQDSSFDYAISNFGIFLFPDREKGWASALRVLKKGAKLVATGWDSSFPPFKAIKKVKMALGMVSGHDVTADNATDNPITFKEEVERAGFENVVVRTISHEFVFVSGEEFIKTHFDNPFFAEISAVEARDVAKRILFANIVGEERVPEGVKVEDLAVWKEPIHFTAVAHVCIATKP
ncbi:hypothetical protein HDU76_013535 [Blyttiomyces sp. JEL0837]|nr:hypothetical protein HDU76_013535 [Blyttiomyces sp. JEL0837]